MLFVLDRFTLDLLGGFRLATSLELTVPEKMLTISVSRKLNMHFKGSIYSK